MKRQLMSLLAFCALAACSSMAATAAEPARQGAVSVAGAPAVIHEDTASYVGVFERSVAAVPVAPGRSMVMAVAHPAAQVDGVSSGTEVLLVGNESYGVSADRGAEDRTST